MMSGRAIEVLGKLENCVSQTEGAFWNLNAMTAEVVMQGLRQLDAPAHRAVVTVEDSSPEWEGARVVRVRHGRRVAEGWVLFAPAALVAGPMRVMSI